MAQIEGGILWRGWVTPRAAFGVARLPCEGEDYFIAVYRTTPFSLTWAP